MVYHQIKCGLQHALYVTSNVMCVHTQHGALSGHTCHPAWSDTVCHSCAESMLCGFVSVGRYVPWWQSMSVLAVFASVWTLPEPPILLLLHCLQEELADDVGLVAALRCMLLFDHLLKLLLVPLVHVVILILPPAGPSYTMMYSHI